jgi:hypothetical protein
MQYASDARVERAMDELSDEERIAHCRGLAIEALKHAFGAENSEIRGAYAEIAVRWSAIADELQRLMLQKYRLKAYRRKNDGD